MKRLLFLFLIVFILQGCFDGLKSVKLVKHPDAPILIQEISGNKIKIAVYSRSRNSMVDFGWIKLSDLQGWTIHKYDWEKFIESRSE